MDASNGPPTATDKVVATSHANLDPSRSLTKRLSDIRKAEAELKRLDAAYVSMKITHSANVLGMDDQWHLAATKLSKLRNTRLGHPGSDTHPHELSPWLDGQVHGYSALTLAKTLLDALVERLAADH